VTRSALTSRWANVATLAGGAAIYFGVRHLTRSSRPTADRHARWIRSLESHLGLNQEAWVQRHTVPHGWIVSAADDIYIYGHWPFIIVALSWLLVHHRAQFAVARNALLLSGGVAMIVFAVLPVTPPRLADPAITDTVTLHTDAYRVLQPPAFTNAYAAMPSLHCGWDLLVATTLASTIATRWLRAMVAAIPLLMAASVVITGNHYLIDVIAGDLLASSALLIVRAHADRSRRRLRPVQTPAPATTGSRAEHITPTAA